MQFTGEHYLVREPVSSRWRGAACLLIDGSVPKGILKGECNDT